MILNKFEKAFISEIATLSGFPELTVRNILELTFLRQLESVMNGESIRIPFIGDLQINFEGDSMEGSYRVAKLSCETKPSDLLKKLIGDIQDGDSNILKKFFEESTEEELNRLSHN